MTTVPIISREAALSLRSYISWRVISIITFTTSLILLLVTYWYHAESIASIYALSGSLGDTVSYLFALLFGLPSLLSWPITLGLITTIILMQLNGWLLVCYRRSFAQAAGSKRSTAVGIGGLIAGLFGIGCSACGTTLLVGILGTVGGVPLLALLPWHGSELLLIGIVLMLGTTVFLLRKLLGPRTCPTT